MEIAPCVVAHDDEPDDYSMNSLFGEKDDDTGIFERQPSEYGMFADNSRCSSMTLKAKKLKRKPARPARRSPRRACSRTQ